jgi:hypothetical protein
MIQLKHLQILTVVIQALNKPVKVQFTIQRHKLTKDQFCLTGIYCILYMLLCFTQKIYEQQTIILNEKLKNTIVIFYKKFADFYIMWIKRTLVLIWTNIIIQ